MFAPRLLIRRASAENLVRTFSAVVLSLAIWLLRRVWRWLRRKRKAEE